MFLIGKQYVYRQRCLKEPIQFQALKAQIFHIESIEKYIAIKNNRLRVHQKNWMECLGETSSGRSQHIVEEYRSIDSI